MRGQNENFSGKFSSWKLFTGKLNSAVKNQPDSCWKISSCGNSRIGKPEIMNAPDL
jgi:hypothetical protein